MFHAAFVAAKTGSVRHIDRRLRCQRERFSKAQLPLRLSVEIDECEAAAAGNEFGRERIIAHRGAAEMRGERGDVHCLVDLDAQKLQCLAAGGFAGKRNTGKTQEAGGVWRIGEAGDEGGLDEVEIGLGLRPARLAGARIMRRLPLYGAARGIVAHAVRMVMVTMVMVVRMIVMHCSGPQNDTGLSMI